MGNYASNSDIYNVIPMVGSETEITSLHIANFINEAESIINTYLSNSYTVPISGGAPILTTLTVGIACYRLLARRVFTAQQLKDSVWPDRFKEDMEILEEIASGDAAVVTTSGTILPATVAAGGVWSNQEGYVQTTSELDPEYERVDPVKEDDLSAERN